MMMKVILLLCVLAVCSCTQYKRVCYYTNWAQYRNGAKFNANTDYEVGLCTHILYAFGKVSSTPPFAIIPYEWNDLTDGYPAVTNWKKSDPNLKVLLAVGGWTHSSNGFKEMVQTKDTRKQFILGAVSYLKKHKFDGLDLDWEYPGLRGSSPADIPKFTYLCKELKEEFSKPWNNLIISAAVAAGIGTINNAYEVAEIAKYLDFINLMTYDLYGSWKAETGHHTDTRINTKQNEHDVIKSINYWKLLIGEIDPSKLILGLATYGRTWTLDKPCSQWQLGSNAKGPGAQGSFTRAAGFLAYYEICNTKWHNHKCTTNSLVNAPYGSDGSNFISYDDPESIEFKISVMKHHDMGGFMVWALDLDDFAGNKCNQGKYPLIKAATKALTGKVDFTCEQKISTSTCPTTPATTPPVTTSTCQMPGIGDRKYCYLNPNGLWKDSSTAKWCQNTCVNEKTCKTNMCCCVSKSATTTKPKTTTMKFTTEKSTTKPITTKSTTTKFSTETKPTSKSTTTTTKPTTTTTSTKPTPTRAQCEVAPDTNDRTNCKVNPQSPFPYMDFWCKSTCPAEPTCTTFFCCCDRKN